MYYITESLLFSDSMEGLERGSCFVGNSIHNSIIESNHTKFDNLMLLLTGIQILITVWTELRLS